MTRWGKKVAEGKETARKIDEQERSSRRNAERSEQTTSSSSLSTLMPGSPSRATAHPIVPSFPLQRYIFACSLPPTPPGYPPLALHNGWHISICGCTYCTIHKPRIPSVQYTPSLQYTYLPLRYTSFCSTHTSLQYTLSCLFSTFIS